MTAEQFKKYEGKRTTGRVYGHDLSGGIIVGYTNDSFPNELLAIDSNSGWTGPHWSNEAIITNKEYENDYLSGLKNYLWVTFDNVIMDESKEITESNKKTVMEARNVEVTLETAKRWYVQGGEFKEMALSAFTEAELNPIRNEWEDRIIAYGTRFVSGWFLGGDCVYKETNEENTDRSTFKTEKQAKSALAYAQLTQLMALPEYNGDWVPDWSDGDVKYIIRRYRSSINLDYYTKTHHFLAFKSAEVCENFLENNLDLLKEYFELD